ncbi:MAG: 2,3-bisphosphoglycerate-independent phosphoglycerate mutase [bacterium]|nr:2,3-bisphosphoglycerate-independent phosphoglycerate mutase [bacterium]
MSTRQKNIVLIIRDGWGINPNPEYNAVANAKTPNMDLFLKKYPYTVLESAGESVGLPSGYQGSSEVGHLNIGAGRIVEQELKRINEAIKDGSFFKNLNFQKTIGNCKNNNSCLHLMGLIQDEGVHAHQEHLFAIMKYAQEQNVGKLRIHFFADGRDTPPKSALEFLRTLNEKINEYKIGEIATVIGRYYAMDRGANWNLTTKAYESLTKAIGMRLTTAQEAIQTAYGQDLTDEYITPTIIGDFDGIKDGDSVIHFNYRQDRAIQLTRAFVDEDYPGQRERKLDITYCGLTRYYDTFPYYILEPMDESEGMGNLLGEVISNHGLTQLRISETQKFRHVTSFFNGKLIVPYKLEERIEIKSMYDPKTFAQHPQMNAYDVTSAVIKEINSGRFDFIVLNLANCDMVGHTGDYQAAIKAVEVVDECVGRVVETVLSREAIALVTSDHGNAEEMVDYKTGLVKTAHTTNPVEFIYIADNYQDIKLKNQGILSDIAPTILYLLGIEKPKEMSSENLILNPLG